MSYLACIAVGLIAGWLAERFMRREHSLLTNLVVGVIGAWIGAFLFSSLMGLHYVEGFNLATIVVSTVGAVVLLAVVGGASRRTSP